MSSRAIRKKPRRFGLPLSNQGASANTWTDVSLLSPILSLDKVIFGKWNT
jgi:hypothetical protein